MISASLNTAQGYLEIGMFAEAGETLDSLPPEDRGEPQVLAIRVQILLGVGSVENARIVAAGTTRKFPHSGDAWLALARVEIADGNLEAAKAALKNCFQCSSHFRLAALDDPHFGKVWGGNFIQRPPEPL